MVNKMDKKYVTMSRFLSLVLRHKPETIGIKLDKDGWTSVDVLLKACQITADELRFVVANNDKKRFEFNSDETRIRASQGHSVPVDLGYKAQRPPAKLYHGTAEKSIDDIMEKGIEKRRRHDVHLSTSLETSASVGQRHGKLVQLEINSGAMYADGYEFRLSTNGVWLTEFVPVKYIKRI
jgi:putative RNA 2'-phosphotransferase